MDHALEQRLQALEQRLQIAEDKDAIAQLQARYIDFNDGGWKGPTHQFPQAVADLFVEDGIWEGPEGTGCAVGRQQIYELFVKFGAVPFIIHCITNPIVEIDGDTAHAEWHAIIPTKMPGDHAIWTMGKYINDYVRTESGWKYKKLYFEAAMVAPYELGWAKNQFAWHSVNE